MTTPESRAVQLDQKVYEHLQGFADRFDYDVELSEILRALVAEAIENSMVGDRVVARLNLVHRHNATS